jgi:hypothetical protein
MLMGAEVPDSRVVEVLTAFAPLSDFCLVGGTIYFVNCQARWGALRLEDNATFAAACRLLDRIGVPQFATGSEWSEWVTRTVPLAGGFLYDGQSYRFSEASCTWQSRAGLSVKGIGSGCKLDFANIPFAEAERISDLEGCGWPPLPEHGIRQAAPATASWTVEVDGRSIRVVALEIDCGAYHPEPTTLNVFFQGTAQDPDSGDDRDVSGSLYCRVVS